MTPLTLAEVTRWARHGYPVRIKTGELKFLSSLTALSLDGAFVPVVDRPVLGPQVQDHLGMAHMTVQATRAEDLAIDSTEETYRQILKMRALEALEPQPQTCCRHGTPYGYACPECDAGFEHPTEVQ